jgi:molecular chaperone DnaK (HSP70)
MCAVSLRKKSGYLPSRDESEDSFSDKTFIGIDFGTSTTVVSYLRKSSKTERILETFQIEQPTEFGGTVSHELVNSVVAWKNDKLLFGREAHHARQDLFEGVNVFSSFKMRLGVDLGPIYPETVLKKTANLPCVIESAQDAALVFFRRLREAIVKAAAREKLPDALFFSVSVPASFEANQRRDLVDIINSAGFPVTESCLIDEPNAAFLSYHYHWDGESSANEMSAFDMSNGKKINVLVYDFGAGTCDISILELSREGEAVKSRNRAISRFTAFGGDNIDEAIAREVLLGELLASNPTYEPKSHHADEKLIPRLMPAAERLKIACMDWITPRGFSTVENLRDNGDVSFETNGVDPFKIAGKELSLAKPKITLKQLGDLMEKFLRHDTRTGVVLKNNVISPVVDALNKANMNKSDLSAVLFIGGSSANPLVRKAVMDYLPGAKAIVPPDLRRHVSLGSAIHCYFHHGLDRDAILPITPEPIYVIVKSGLERVIPASAPVPTENDFKTTLLVPNKGQRIVELPFCAGDEQKLLGVLKIVSPSLKGFDENEKILVTASITGDKLLKIEATLGSQRISAELMNPLANKPLKTSEKKLLLAKQKLNAALLKHGSRPPANVIVEYADAAKEAKAWETAADMYATAERINPNSDHSADITYCYSMAGKSKLSDKWAVIAHERNPNAVSAYNLSLREEGENRITLLRESLRHDESFVYSLAFLGKILSRDRLSKDEGLGLLNKFMDIERKKLNIGIPVTEHELTLLEEISSMLGNTELNAVAKSKLKNLRSISSLWGETGGPGPYDADNVAKTSADSNFTVLR